MNSNFLIFVKLGSTNSNMKLFKSGSIINQYPSVLGKIQSFSAKMDFVDPDQYTKSNEAHFNINRRAVNDYVKIYSCFGSQER